MINGQVNRQKTKYLIRPEARKRKPLPKGEVKIRAPKAAEKPPTKPGWTTLLVSAVVPFFMGISFLASGSNPILGIFGMATAVLLPGAQLLKFRQELKQYEQKETERHANYLDYIKQKKDEIITFGQQQQQVLWQEYLPVAELVKRVERQSNQLWQRLPGDDDFLSARVGSSQQRLSVNIVLPDKELEDEPLLENAISLYQQYRDVPDLPFLINLEKVSTLGIRGQSETFTLETVFTLLAHLVTHQSPEQMQLVVISHRQRAEAHWRWVRWLPHVEIVHGDTRLPRLSFHPEQDNLVLTPLAELVEQRLESQKEIDFGGETAAHLIIVFDQLTNLHHHRLIQMLLTNQPREWQPMAMRTSALFIDRIPPQAQALLELQDDCFEYYQLTGGTAVEKPICGNVERTPIERIEKLARAMAPLKIEGGSKSGNTTLPRNVRLVELLGATQPTEIKLAELYGQAYDPRKIMSFPIGINLDLKQQIVTLREDGRGGHGPHAMLAGGTGKGKSVTLQSIVLSLAATNSPKHLNIVLADFKGGASELARLKPLPHIVGFVTDLDEAYVERFRLSLEGEVRRRKRLLEETPALIGRQIPDIYEYNKMLPDQLLPHLLIVIDEFAKALHINPAFKTTLDKDIAAQGRALGIHLILSTQKPADFAALRPNLEVRMSMQVQNPEDSRIIFNRNDAYSKLERAGQAFLQVGDNRVFEMFQVAHTHMPYQPDGATMDLVDDFQIRQLFSDGSRQLLYRHQAREVNPEDGRSTRYETEVLVEHIRDYCESHYAQQRQICLPPLPEAESLPLGQLIENSPVYSQWINRAKRADPLPSQRLIVPMGMMDLPAQQEQRPFLLNLNAKDGNYLVVGPAGTGKALFLRSLVLALATTHTPDELVFYFISQGTTLAPFEELPHCQAYITLAEEERVARLFNFLENEIARRTELLRQTKSGHLPGLRQTYPTMGLPTLIVVIEDFPSFMADQFDRLQEMVNLMASARLADLHFVLSTTAMSGVHAKLQQHIQNRLALNAASPLDVFLLRGKPLPGIIGRSYIQVEQELAECQIAAPYWQTKNDLPEVVASMKQQWQWPTGQRPLPTIQPLAKSISLESLWLPEDRKPSFIESPTAPLGVDYDLARVWLDFNLVDSYNLVIGPIQSGKTEFLLSLVLATAVNFRPQQINIVILSLHKQRSPLRLLRTLPHVVYADSLANAEAALTHLLTDLKKQVHQQKELAARNMENTAEITSSVAKRTLILVDDAQQFSRHANLNQLLDKCLEENSGANLHLFLADTGNNINQIKRDFNIKYIQTACRHGSGIAFSAEQTDLTLLNLVGKVNGAMLKLHGPNMGNGRSFWNFQGQERVVQVGLVADSASVEIVETAVQTLVTQIIQKHPPRPGQPQG